MSSLPQSGTVTELPALNVTLSEKLTQLRQFPGKSAAAPMPAVANPSANKQATDWLEMRRAAGWAPLETNHTSR